MAVNFSEKISGRMSKKDSNSAKNGKEPQKAGNGAGAEKSILPPALKGIGVGLGVTCVIFAVCALVLTYTDMDESYVGIISTVCTALSAAAAGYISAKGRGKRGLITGALTGIAYGIILLVISAAAGGPIDMNCLSFMITAAAGGGIGGILGVNAKG